MRKAARFVVAVVTLALGVAACEEETDRVIWNCACEVEFETTFSGFAAQICATPETAELAIDRSTDQCAAKNPTAESCACVCEATETPCLVSE